MKSPHLQVAALQGLLLAWAPTAAAITESPSSIRMAMAEPDKLTTTMSFTKDGKMSVMEEALSSVVPHASRLGGGGDGIPGVVTEEKQEQQQQQQQQHLQQGGGDGGGGWDGITGGAVMVVTATAVSTTTRTTTIVAHERAAEAAPIGLGIDRRPVTTGATNPSIASVSTAKKVGSSSRMTNDAASGLRWQHDTGLAATAIWVAVVMVFGSIARFSVASFA
ncbi:hypothetical protein MAPG_01622 [Magnaporthiopsis poae ATCC 64411]|uniref:Uncharacterized protein n=1 Tax=Magnaporthiopsis poae (strain ATCC 64411 / 73-15) TaxID=644358 RepID=A0A0C4DP68_MAGP6|nr:hypothetical protein MAPG_01622 [Magnaporthiopsis poae ATCC 64411]